MATGRPITIIELACTIGREENSAVNDRHNGRLPYCNYLKNVDFYFKKEKTTPDIMCVKCNIVG